MQQVPEDWARGVAIVAHPDDLEYGAAGAVARWTAMGKEIAYVLVTSGEAGISTLAPQRCGPLRREEQRRSAAVVGVEHVEFLGHPDGAVEYGIGLRRDLVGVLRRLRPDIVLTMNFDLTWGDDGPINHADHRAVGLAVLDACRDAANRWLFPEQGNAWDGMQAAYVAGDSRPTHFVDVADSLERGIASLEEHHAYLNGLGREFDPRDFLRRLAEFGGMAAGCDLAVLFRRFDLG